MPSTKFILLNTKAARVLNLPHLFILTVLLKLPLLQVGALVPPSFEIRTARVQVHNHHRNQVFFYLVSFSVDTLLHPRVQ